MSDGPLVPWGGKSRRSRRSSRSSRSVTQCADLTIQPPMQVMLGPGLGQWKLALSQAGTAAVSLSPLSLVRVLYQAQTVPAV